MGVFQKGQSGNPGGRPKEDPEIKQLALKLCPRAIARLGEIMESANEKHAAYACSILLDRGAGKPAQAVDLSGQLDVSRLVIKDA